MPVQLVVGVVKRPKCVLVPSTGTATIKGAVLFRGRSVAGAYVTVNCEHTISNRDFYRLTVRSGGQYKVVARFEDPGTGLVLYGERATGKPSDPPIAPSAIVPLDILLSEPPQCMRNVVVQGTVRVDDVYLTGADHAETTFTRTLYVQYGVATFDQAAGKWVIDPDDPAGLARRTDVAQVGASTGDSDGELKIEVVARDDLSVDVTLIGMINPGDENLTQTKTINLPPGPPIPIDDFDLDTGGPFNDRAYFRGITITNLPAQAI
jgi:hypothetical protein